MSASTSARASHLLASAPPAAAVAIDGRRVAGVSVTGHGTSLVVSGHASQALPPGAVTPALNGVNVHDPAALAAAVTSVLDGLSPRPRRVALVLPDAVGKVSLVRFEKIPARAQDLDQLIRWQVRKAAPYRIDDAQVAWIPGIELPGGGREFIVTTARRDVVESYERACAAAGAHAGIVDLATLNLVNAALAVQGQGPSTGSGQGLSASSGQASTGDWLLVHVTEDDTALAVVRGATLIFYRYRDGSAGEDLAGLVHQTAMYHEDRLGGGGFSRVFLAGASSRGAEQAVQLRRELETHAGVRVEPLDFRGAVTLRDRIVASPELLDSLGAPLGTLLREQVA
jgi:Tfp pilus assembly PilM family ATPase